MLATTLDLFRAALRSDATVSPAERSRILTLIRHNAAPPVPLPPANDGPRILRRKQAAERCGCSLRLIDRLAQQGALPKVRLPGRQRAAGFRESDVLKLIGGVG